MVRGKPPVPEKYNHVEGAFTSERGESLYTQRWEPVDGASVRGLVYVVHGLGEHSGRYSWFATKLVEQGFAVLSMDHVGHGRSQGTKGYVHAYTFFVDDFLAYLAQTVTLYQPYIPVFVFGHSMGGGLSLHICRRWSSVLPNTSLTGVILSSPLIIPGSDATPFLRWAARSLSYWLPGVPVKTLDARSVSRDPAVVENYMSDPLVYHGSLSARLGAELLRMCDDMSALDFITFPVILLQAGNDKLVDPRGAQIFDEKVHHRDKTVKVYPGLYHELLNEPEKEEIFQDIIQWILPRTSSKLLSDESTPSS